MKEECGLCGTVLPYYSLRRCYRCGRWYCRNCTMFTEDGSIICLGCARRMVSPRRLGTKYSPLSRYLARRAQYSDRVTLSFAKIEGIIGDNLPFSAQRYQHWWSNTPSRGQAQAWLNVGWRVYSVDLGNRTVTFKRVAEPEMETGKKRGRGTRRSAKKLFRPPKPRALRRRRTPSMTRIAKAQARLINVERKKSSVRRYRGKFKPQPVYEKRLYKPEAKPKE